MDPAFLGIMCFSLESETSFYFLFFEKPILENGLELSLIFVLF